MSLIYSIIDFHQGVKAIFICFSSETQNSNQSIKKEVILKYWIMQ